MGGGYGAGGGGGEAGTDSGEAGEVPLYRSAGEDGEAQGERQGSPPARGPHGHSFQVATAFCADVYLQNFVE